MDVYQTILSLKKQKSKALAVLIDPDKCEKEGLCSTVQSAEKAKVDYFFVGSSILMSNTLPSCISLLKKSSIPVVLFPGSHYQINKSADALLLLSLISGRNPEYLIGQQVTAAAELKRSGLEIIPTGYMLIEGGSLTSVNYISQTFPIPFAKPDIAISTAIAGEMLGMKLIYLEAGSGAKKPVSSNMISAVRENISIPLIAGGGIKDAERAFESCKAGADLIVVGNGVEEEPSRVFEIASAVHEAGAPIGKITSD